MNATRTADPLEAGASRLRTIAQAAEALRCPPLRDRRALLNLPRTTAAQSWMLDPAEMEADQAGGTPWFALPPLDCSGGGKNNDRGPSPAAARFETRVRVASRDQVPATAPVQPTLGETIGHRLTAGESGILQRASGLPSQSPAPSGGGPTADRLNRRGTVRPVRGPPPGRRASHATRPAARAGPFSGISF